MTRNEFMHLERKNDCICGYQWTKSSPHKVIIKAIKSEENYINFYACTFGTIDFELDFHIVINFRNNVIPSIFAISKVKNNAPLSEYKAKDQILHTELSKLYYDHYQIDNIQYSQFSPTI